MQQFDLNSATIRELNQYLHDHEKASVQVTNPAGKHALAVGIDSESEVTIDGHVGYYCAGMNKHASVTINGNAGPTEMERLQQLQCQCQGVLS